MPELELSLVWIAAAAALAGMVRGFAGFGAAMIFVPLAATMAEPRSAVIWLFLIDGVAQLPLLPAAARRCVWREIVPLFLGAAVTVPLGVWLLVTAEPTTLRWGIGIAVLAATAVMASGWRYRGAAGWPASLGVGGVSGIAGGAASLSGPPVVLFWLGGQADAATARANLIVFFGLTTLLSGANFALAGLFSWQLVFEAALFAPCYAAAMWLGAHAFGLAPERYYRRLALTLCAGAALAGLPLWQSLG